MTETSITILDRVDLGFTISIRCNYQNPREGEREVGRQQTLQPRKFNPTHHYHQARLINGSPKVSLSPSLHSPTASWWWWWWYPSHHMSQSPTIPLPPHCYHRFPFSCHYMSPSPYHHILPPPTICHPFPLPVIFRYNLPFSSIFCHHVYTIPEHLL